MSHNASYPWGTGSYNYNAGANGVPGVNYHPGARQGFARASYSSEASADNASMFCMYSGTQTYESGNHGDTYNTDLGCLFTKTNSMSGVHDAQYVAAFTQKLKCS